jgi:hypothetical protein
MVLHAARSATLAARIPATPSRLMRRLADRFLAVGPAAESLTLRPALINIALPLPSEKAMPIDRTIGSTGI